MIEMAMVGTVVALWGTFMIGYTIYHVKSKGNTKKIKYLDLSKYEIKYKKIDSSLNDKIKSKF
jgi:hypothetical protein